MQLTKNYGLASRIGAALAAGAYASMRTKKVNVPRPSAYSRPSTKRKRYSGKSKKKSYGKKKGKVAKLERRVNKLSKEVNDTTTTLKYRTRDTGSILVAGDNVTHNSASGFNYTILADAMQKLQYFNAATGEWGTLAITTGTGIRNYRVQYASSQLDFKNNYQVPCKVSVYLATPIQDNSVDLIAQYNNNVSDNVINTLSPVANSNPLIYISDSEVMAGMWNIKKFKSFNLEPGQCGSCYHIVKDINFDKITFTQTYQRKYKSFEWIIRVEGGRANLSHDTADATKVGTGRCGIDFQQNLKLAIDYDGGAQANRIYVGFTKSITDANAVVSSKPVADNIGYSVV